MTDTDFSISERTQVVAGAGSVDSVAEHARNLGAKRVFVVTDEHLLEVGHAQRVMDRLRAAGMGVHLFEGVHENPTTVDVDDCVAAVEAAFGRDEPDVVVAVGGGSTIDVAKGCLFMRAGGGRMEDYWGVGKARGKLRPLIAIPTTAGTGSEVQSFTLIGKPDTHQKMACGDPQAAPKIAILDETLTVTQPAFVTACTGLDAIGHAVETLVTKKRNDVSHDCATRAFVLANRSFPTVLASPNDLDARADMLHAAAFAGLAIENSMLGAAHSIANPLTAHHDIAHGEAVGLALPHVVRFNAEVPEVRALYVELAQRAELVGADVPADHAVEALVSRLEQFLDAAAIPRLHERDELRADLAILAPEAARQWTAQFNPREVEQSDFETLLTDMLTGR